MIDDDAVLPLHGVPPSKDVRDLTDRRCCCICGRVLRKAYWVCVPCRREHDLPDKYKDWPEWAKFLKNSEKVRRYELYESIESRTEVVSYEEFFSYECDLDDAESDDFLDD